MKSYQLSWKTRALKRLDGIVEEISKRWNITAVDNYLEAIKEREQVLTRFPEAFPLLKQDEGIRRTIINGRTVIFYEVDYQNNVVEILSVYDTNQDPDSFSLRE